MEVKILDRHPQCTECGAPPDYTLTLKNVQLDFCRVHWKEFKDLVRCN